MSNGRPKLSTSIRKSPVDDAARRTVVVVPRDRPMNVFCFVSRRSALSVFALGLAALAGGSAHATGDIYVHAGANFKPVTIAVTPFAGEDAGEKISGVVAADFARSIFLLPLNPANFPET